jgi:hypothetical protein
MDGLPNAVGPVLKADAWALLWRVRNTPLFVPRLVHHASQSRSAGPNTNERVRFPPRVANALR